MHKTMPKIYSFPLFISLLILTNSCRDELLDEDDELSLQRQDYNGSELRFDGIYYSEYVQGHYHRFALYRNGVIRDLGSSNEKNDPNFLSGNSKADWGVFQINNSKIEFERWYPSSGWISKAYVRSGEILNDSTFIITESYRNQNGEKTEIEAIDETYHFKQFSPKPDSTNNFVK